MWSRLSYLFEFDNWPVLLCQRVFFRKARLLAFRREGMEFVLDYSGGDHCGVLPCLTSGMYSQYFSVLKTGKPLKVLDLGANAGGFCLALLAAGMRFEKLVCIEMNRHTHSRLQFNILQNFNCEAVIVNAAVGGRMGSIRIPDNRGGVNEHIFADLTIDTKVFEVQMLTVNEIVQCYFGGEKDAYIDVCKMDIEGAERDVFLSATCDLVRRVRFLIIELHFTSAATEAEVISKIKSLGFEDLSKAPVGGETVRLFRNVNT